MNSQDLRDEITRFLREGMSIKQVMRKLGLSEEDRDIVESRYEDPMTWGSESDFRRRLERGRNGE